MYFSNISAYFRITKKHFEAAFTNLSIFTLWTHNQGQFLPIRNLRWCGCNYLWLFNCVYIKSDCVHFENGSEQCVDILRHEVAQQLPTFYKTPVMANCNYLQVTKMWHEHSVIRIFPSNRTVIHEAHVKAGPLITWISRSASPKKLMGICMHFQSRKTLTIACTIMSAECLCCWYIDLLQCAGEWAASKSFCQQDKGFPDSRVIPDMAFRNRHL